MFCPKCGAEYRNGFYECSDCQVPLVSESPVEGSTDPGPGANSLELVSLLEIENPIRLALIRSVLEAEGIECLVRGESPHALGGIEFISRRRKVVLQVAQEDEEKARELIHSLELSHDDPGEAK